jgi:hypothetical protein
MFKKLIIAPWFGERPEWFGEWETNIKQLEKYGFDTLYTDDLDAFKKRVNDKLQVTCPIVPGTGKLWDYRMAFGVLYEDELKGYDFWGQTDLDCIYGNVGKFVTDDMLIGLDIHSNDSQLMCGCWSLHRNIEKVNKLFMECPRWKEFLENPNPVAWHEKEFSRLVRDSGLRQRYTHWQGKCPTDDSKVHFVGDSLYDGHDEIMMFHFRHLKRWPANAIQNNRGV